TSFCCIKTAVGQACRVRLQARTNISSSSIYLCWPNRQKLCSIELRQPVSSHSDIFSIKK
ncbi:hypothetical protein RRG08_057805, partial [Elysia crispata]